MGKSLDNRSLTQCSLGCNPMSQIKPTDQSVLKKSMKNNLQFREGYFFIQ
jgi:hypothetical protein